MVEVTGMVVRYAGICCRRAVPAGRFAEAYIPVFLTCLYPFSAELTPLFCRVLSARVPEPYLSRAVRTSQKHVAERCLKRFWPGENRDFTALAGRFREAPPTANKH